LSTAPAPRLCHVVKWNENDGFGFHLLADKSRQGQYIGKVDVGSAAEAAGLKLGDRIIEINGVNVTNQTHKEVVARIKAIPNETKMLVIDPQGEMYYKERNLAIKSTQPNVRYIKTPPKNTRPSTLPLSYSVTDSSSQPNNKPHTSLKVQESPNVMVNFPVHI
jgi:Na(+)/H(+) exchange regulatory cofactor NHE-RF2